MSYNDACIQHLYNIFTYFNLRIVIEKGIIIVYHLCIHHLHNNYQLHNLKTSNLFLAAFFFSTTKMAYDRQYKCLLHFTTLWLP